MQNELIQQGLVLLLAGMGTVFVFLTALVIALSAMSRLLAQLSPGGSGEGDDEEIAAITAAIRKHRNQ